MVQVEDTLQDLIREQIMNVFRLDVSSELIDINLLEISLDYYDEDSSFFFKPVSFYF